MSKNTSEADVIFNRVNVALARSQKLINSWLPPKSAEDEKAEAQNDDEDFSTMTETGGIGSKAAFDGDDESYSSQAVSKHKSNDKFLEMLLGKKAATAHKKSQESKKHTSLSRHAAPRTREGSVKRTREVESDDEDGSGRAASFKSRRTRQEQPLVLSRPSEYDTTEAAVSAAELPKTAGEMSPEGINAVPAPSDEEADSKAARKKSGSYLDELLSQKAKKRKRKKPKQVKDD